jgi:hypothetical protein
MIFQFGTGITNPFSHFNAGSPLATATQGEGLIIIASNLIKFMIVIAGLYAFWNLIMSGYMFMSAAGDPKAIGKAWEKIWMSLIGLLVVAGSFILAAIFGYLIFKDPSALLTPRIFTP